MTEAVTAPPEQDRSVPPRTMLDVRPKKSVALSPPSRSWPILWLLVSLVVFPFLPGMMSGNYLPKMFWVSATVGLGLALLPPRLEGVFRLSRLGAVWLAYLGWALISLTWAPSPRVGFERWLVMILFTLAYLLAARTRFWESKFFWRGFCLVAILASAVGILQYYFPDLPLVNSFPGTAVPRSTMGHRNYSAMYFMVILPFLAWYYFSARGRESLLSFLALLFALGFLLLAKTRGAWLGVMAGAAFFFLAGGGRKLVGRRTRIGWLAGGVLAAMFLAIAVRPAEPVARLMAGKADLIQTVGTVLDPRDRLEFWSGIPGLTDPLFGAGFGNFPIVATPSVRDGLVMSLNWEVHNDYLQAYVDLGVPGAVLFVLLFAVLIGLAWRGRRRGVLLAAGTAIFGLAVMQFTVFTMFVVSVQAWIAGVAAVLNNQEKTEPFFQCRFPSGAARALNIMAVIWLAVFALAIGYSIRGDIELRKTHNELRQYLSLEKMLEIRERIHPRDRESLGFERVKIEQRLQRLTGKILPSVFFDANMKHLHCFQLARLAEQLSEYPTAGEFARIALELHPHDRINLATIAEIALKEGRRESAYAYLKRGVELFGCNPYHPFFAENLAQLYRDQGDPAAALAIEEKLESNVVGPLANPYPANLERRTPTRLVLSWDPVPAGESYDVFIWTTGDPTPDYPRFSGLRESRIPREITLRPGTTYIWRVRAVGRYGEELGDLWVFRTADEFAGQ